MERPLLRLAPVAAAAILLASGCGGERDPVPGSALEPVAGSTYGVGGIGALPPGREYAIAVTPLRNASGSDLEIRRIEPIGEGVQAGGAAPVEVTRLALAVRDPALAETIPLGFYFGPRLAVEADGACVEQPVVEPEGHVLAPQRSTEKEAFLVLGLRTVAPGTWTLAGQRVVYEQDGRMYRQEFLAGLEIEVRAGADPDVPPEQAPCLAR